MGAVKSAKAAPASRSWVGRVRVVGAADVIDALDAWQKRPFRRIPSPGQQRSGSFGSRSELVSGPGSRFVIGDVPVDLTDTSSGSG